MAKKIFLLVIASFLCFGISVKADEGMWLPLLLDRLNSVDMQKMGCKLTAEEIYSVNNSSLKDAIVAINNGYCSGFTVSGEGLMLTNHHCAYNYIQNHSTVEKDYLTNGFWAMDKNEELRNDKLNVSFLIKIEDVSGKILPFITDKMSEIERTTVVDSITSLLEKEAIKGTTYGAKVLSFFEGNEYYMFITETYKDVRLVGAPPESIGKFGADTDNWMWPRHTGDFALFRVYMSPDGAPAEYSKKNIPYKPKKYLPISLKGVKKDDFAMVLGYPGTSDRFMTSYGVKLALDKYNPSIVKIREKRLALMNDDMKASDEVKIQYAAKYATIANYYKYYIGQSDQLQKLGIYDKKVAIEKAFTEWYSSDASLKQKYSDALSEIEKAYNNIGKYTVPYIYYKEAIIRGIEILSYANTFEEIYKQMKLEVDEEALNKLTQSLTYAAKLYFKNYNLETDKKICKAMLEMFNEDVAKEYLPDVFTTIQKKYKSDISAYVEDLYSKSIFASKDKILEFLTKPDYKKLDKDMGYVAMTSFYNKYKDVMELYNNAKLELTKGNRLFVAGIMDMNSDKKYYPNANSTMRLTYGKVTDYSPNPSTKYNYFTTLDQMIAKEDPKNPEFEIPSKLKQLYKNKDFGKYATDSVVPLCFITNDDVTGGVSGAPVINGNGELIGIVFDINWEATSVPILFDENYQRTIAVDIKFVLFIIDKYAGASNIIKELNIIE
ncbi:MAG: S46 family peptidase [Bacteroidota bacterium]